MVWIRMRRLRLTLPTSRRMSSGWIWEPQVGAPSLRTKIESTPGVFIAAASASSSPVEPSAVIGSR